MKLQKGVNFVRTYLFFGTGIFILLGAVLWLTSRAGHALSGQTKIILLAILGLGGILIVGNWLELRRELLFLREKNQKEERLRQMIYQKMENILRVSQQFATAKEEKPIIDLSLKLIMEMIGASGVTFTPLDDRGQSLSPHLAGELPSGITLDWLEYLSSATIRQSCPNCQNLERLNMDCPMLKGAEDETVIYCAPVRRADQEYGIFHLFMKEEGLQTIEGGETIMHEDGESLLKLIAEQTALALEGIRLRKREAIVSTESDQLRKQIDAGLYINELVKSLRTGLSADCGYAYVWDAEHPDFVRDYIYGETAAIARPLIQGILQTVRNSKEPVIIGELSGASAKGVHIGSLVATPIISQDGRMWGVLAGSSVSSRAFNERHLVMLKAMASQAAFVLQNASAIAEFEYKAILQERIRLAREIHDGLAQTLGFLKLKISQMRMYLEQGERERARQTMGLLYETVSDAYLEARYAIDQLRVSVDENNFQQLLKDMIAEFREASGVDIEYIQQVDELRLPMEVNAQLIRIVQEAFSNIRKHARAKRVQLYFAQRDDDLILEIRDDGIGFYPDQIHRQSQYGLRGMKERAELLGADLQIISRPEEGTIVQVRLPLYPLREKGH